MAIRILVKLISGYFHSKAEWLAFLLLIWDVPGSNLGPKNGYPK
jgi:hypothetical protein